MSRRVLSDAHLCCIVAMFGAMSDSPSLAIRYRGESQRFSLFAKRTVLAESVVIRGVNLSQIQFLQVTLTTQSSHLGFRCGPTVIVDVCLPRA